MPWKRSVHNMFPKVGTDSDGRKEQNYMSFAICYKCGARKSGALVACSQCQAVPRNLQEASLSLALSDSLSSEHELSVYSGAIKNGERLSIPGDVLSRASDAVSDPQLKSMILGETREAATADVVPATKSRTTPTLEASSVAKVAKPQYHLETTDLHQSPFAILGATIRDDRRRIVELAENKSLELDYDVCQKARGDLTNTRTRLNAEMAWLPGVSPRRAEQCLQKLLNDPMAIREEFGLPTLSSLNLQSAAFSAVDEDHDPDDLVDFIVNFAYLAEDLDAEELIRDINEERAVSGFPQINSITQVESELLERRRYYRNTVKDCLNRLPPRSLISVMTRLLEETTYGGEEHAPHLVDDLVDSYETETQGVLEAEADNIQKLLDSANRAAPTGEAATKPIIDNLLEVARNWDSIAQPIQLSAKARGIDHIPSMEIAYSIRGLAIDLFNEYGMLEQSRRLTTLLQELFVELPEVSEHLESDADALADIASARAQAEANRAQWERDIAYQVDVGAVFKETLSISSTGISWKGKNYPLEAITRIRWGGVRHSVNGIPTGTNLTVAFGDRSSEAVVNIRRKETYGTFVDKLWRAVGVRLISEMMEDLKTGRTITIGAAVIHDDGVLLEKHKFWGANEKVKCSWSQVKIWSADGSFCIGSKQDEKTYVALSYIDVANTHLLEQIIRMAFKKPGMKRISDLLT